MSTGVSSGSPIREVRLTRAQILDLIEKGAQARRGLSAAQLVRLYRGGALDNPGEVADLLALADLLPPDDPLFTAA